MGKTIIDDGFQSHLVQDAEFCGRYDIPMLKRQDIALPTELVPFDKRRKVDGTGKALHFYMYDIKFRQILTATDRYLGELAKFDSVITPDCSLYWNMPLCLQITNTYFNRAVGYYLQMHGMKVIPNIRWGLDESFNFCFDGVPEHSIVAISTHACLKHEDQRSSVKRGLYAMMEVLEPETVIVHGAMPKDIFEPYLDKADFHQYDSWLVQMKKLKTEAK